MIPQIDNPAIPSQFAGSVHDAITFADQARRGACGTYQELIENGGRQDSIERAQADLYATTKLLFSLTMTHTPFVDRVVRVWNDDEGEHDIYIDGNLEFSHRRTDQCDAYINRFFEHEATVNRKNLQNHGIQPPLTTPAALIASLGEDDDPITDEEVEAEIGYMLRGEKAPVKEPYVKNLWEKGSSAFRAEMKLSGFPQGKNEPPELKVARMAWLSRHCGRPITTTKKMSADELFSCADALRRGDAGPNWTDPQHVAA